MAMHPMGTRDEWKALKKKHGIPDGVAKFSLGDKINAYNKTVDALAPTEMEQEIDALEGMLPLMKTYEAELKKLKPTKFKGKSPSEQTKNFNDAKAEVKTMLSRLEDRLGFVKMQARPMAHLLKYYQSVMTKYKALDSDDEAAVKHFYAQEMRNTLGLAVASAKKLALGQNVLAALNEYTTLMGSVDNLVQGRSKPLNPNVPPSRTAYLQCGKALAALKDHLK